MEVFIIIMVMEDSRKSFKKIIIILVILAVLGGISVLVYNLLKSAELSIMVAPTEATVTIDGKEYTNGQYKFFPRNGVEIEISAPGYKTQNIELDLMANQVTPLRAVLEDEDGGYESYLATSESFELLKMVSAEVENKELLDFVNSVKKRIGILDILPVNENQGEFYVDQHGFIVSMDANAAILQIMASGDDCGVVPCIDVYESNGDLEKARSYIRKKGYNPDDYEYNMSDLYLYEPNYEYPDSE